MRVIHPQAGIAAGAGNRGGFFPSQPRRFAPRTMNEKRRAAPVPQPAPCTVVIEAGEAGGIEKALNQARDILLSGAPR